MAFWKDSQDSLSVSGYILEVLAPDSSQTTLTAARELLIEYGHFVQSHPNIAHFCFGDLEIEAAQLPHSYLNAGGGALLALVSGKPVGFVAWRELANRELANAFEVKRLWVRPAGRGLGIGRALIQSLEKRAQAAGKASLFLDTSPESMPEAYRLYHDLGFRDCLPYDGKSPAGIVYMRKNL